MQNAQDESICCRISRIAHILLDRGRCEFATMILTYRKLYKAHKWCEYCASVMNRMLTTPDWSFICGEIYIGSGYSREHIYSVHDIFISALKKYGMREHFSIPEYIKIDAEMAHTLAGYNYYCAEMDPYIDHDAIIHLIAATEFNAADYAHVGPQMKYVFENRGGEIMQLFLQNVAHMSDDEIAAIYFNFGVRFRLMSVDIQRRYMDAISRVNPLFILDSTVMPLNIIAADTFPVENFAHIMSFSNNKKYVEHARTMITKYLATQCNTRCRRLSEYFIKLMMLIISRYPSYIVALVHPLRFHYSSLAAVVSCRVICPQGYDREDIFLKACALKPRLINQYSIFLDKWANARITFDHLRRIWHAEQAELNIPAESQMSLEDLIYIMMPEMGHIDVLAADLSDESRRIIKCLFDKWTINADWHICININKISDAEHRNAAIDFAAKIIFAAPILIKLVHESAAPDILQRIHDRLDEELLCLYRIARKYMLPGDIKNIITTYIINADINLDKFLAYAQE
jgi:hypothetical protein